MASFREICFTPAEFARIAQIDKNLVPALEQHGLLKTIRKRIGNVDRKLITLEDTQAYFENIRNTVGRHGDRFANPLAEKQPDSTTQNPVATATDSAAAGATVAPMSEEDRVAASKIPGAMNLSDLLAALTIPGKPTHKTQMFYNVKGGTGKSTLTAQYVMRAAMMGYRILAVDLDGQGHLTLNLDVLDGHERPTIYDVLINDLPMSDAIVNVAPMLDLLPANLGLCNIEIPLNQKPRREYRLSEAIETIADRYDLIVADTNPAASILNCSMLVAADLVNVICATNPLSFHGMSLVMSTLETMEREFRKKIEIKIVPNMYDNREVISQEVLGELQSQFPDRCAKSVINRCADLNEATKRRTTVWDVSSKSAAAHDIDRLTQELLFV